METRYFKGNELATDRHVLFSVTTHSEGEPPRNRIFGMDKDIKVIALDDPNGTYVSYATFEEFHNNAYIFNGEYVQYHDEDIKKETERRFFVSREISKEEFEYFDTLKVLLREVWMHDLTGGYPRSETVKSNIRRLDRDYRNLEKVYFS